MDSSIYSGGKRKIKSPSIRGIKFSISKIFLIIVVILIITYFIIQMAKNKYGMKYTITLFILLILSLAGYFVLNLKLIMPVVKIAKVALGLGVPIAFLILNILMGRNIY